VSLVAPSIDHPPPPPLSQHDPSGEIDQNILSSLLSNMCIDITCALIIEILIQNLRNDLSILTTEVLSGGGME
jgi:hypothetical protein